jgi:hypothetical protein
LLFAVNEAISGSQDGGQGGGQMAKSAFDKEDGKGKKRGRPKAASEESAKADEELRAPEKPKRPRRNAAERAAEKGEEEKQAAKGTRKTLRKAVKKVVKKECEKIARALVEETQKGNMRSTAVMLSMIEKKSDEGSARHGGLTAADLLGSEEEWEGETEGTGTRD